MDPLLRVLGGDPGTPVQYPRPAVGTVHSTAGGLYVDIDGIVHGPCKCSLPAAHAHSNPEGGSTGSTSPTVPPVGTECLVYFPGAGIETPWVLIFSGWPA